MIANQWGQLVGQRLLHSRRAFRLFVLFLSFVLSALLVNLAYGDVITTQLSRHTQFQDDGVRTFEISPSGEYIVYHAAGSLWSVRSDGSAAPVRLTAPLVESYTRLWYRMSPDSKYVVYTSDPDQPSIWELYSVPISGGSPIKLNPPLVMSGTVADQEILITPDSLRVVYRADQDTYRVKELYSVPIAGGDAVKLNGELTAGGEIRWNRYWLSADGQWVVYLADQDTDEMYELYSVPIGGGQVTKLNQPLAPGGYVLSSVLTSDSQHVVYQLKQGADARYELFSVPLVGETPVRLNGNLTASGDVRGFSVSHSGEFVIYYADQEVDQIFALYRVPVIGGEATRILPPLPAGHRIWTFEITPDDAYVVYRAGFDSHEAIDELYSVPSAGGGGTKLNAPIIGQNPVAVVGYQVSRDSSWVVYHTQRIDFWWKLDPNWALLSVPVGGGTATRLSGSTYSGTYAISPASTYVAYQVASGEYPNVDLAYYVTPLGGGPTRQLYGLNALNQGSFKISPDSNFVAYLAHDPTDMAEKPLLKLFVARDAPPRIGFSSESMTVFEEDGTVQLTVGINQPTTFSTAAVDYQVTGETTLAPANVALAAGAITIPPGELTKTITVTLPVDAFEQPLTPLVVSLSNPRNATLSSQSTLTITVYEGAPRVVDFVESAQSIFETDPTAALEVKLDRPTASFTATVHYLVDGGTATPGIDFHAEDGVLNFESGELTRTIAITPLLDSIVEPDETVLIRLVDPQFATLGNQTTITLTLRDVPPPAVSFTVPTLTVVEDQEAVTITVALDQPTHFFTPTVQYAVAGGTATRGVDYMLEDGFLTFQPGEESHTITMLLLADEIAEPAETVLIRLSEPANAILGAYPEIALVLLDGLVESDNVYYLPLIQP